MNTTVIILVVVVVVLLVVVAGLGVMRAKRGRTQRLRKKFGPEYERHVAETGDRNTAETQLREREQRRAELDIRELRPPERERFQQSWSSVQGEFVDDPAQALRNADRLVNEIMRVRGYPVEDFERRAEDLSVDHPAVVRHYRDARAVHDASDDAHDGSGDAEVDTERQRHALTAYRSLVEALLAAGATGQPHAQRPATSNTGTHDSTHDQPAGATPRTQERNR